MGRGGGFRKLGFELQFGPKFVFDDNGKKLPGDMDAS